MPFVAHNNEWFLGFGDTADEAKSHMRRDHPSLEPIVQPASLAVVNALKQDPLSDPSTGKLYMEVNHVGPSFEGVAVLPEEFQVLRHKKDMHGLRHDQVRAELDQLLGPA